MGERGWRGAYLVEPVTALAEDPPLGPSTHMAAHNHLTPAPKIQLCHLRAQGTQVTHIHTHRGRQTFKHKPQQLPKSNMYPSAKDWPPPTHYFHCFSVFQLLPLPTLDLSLHKGDHVSPALCTAGSWAAAPLLIGTHQ